MGQTVPSAAILLMQEQPYYSQFKKAMARSDQIALVQLFIYANPHMTEAAYTAFIGIFCRAFYFRLITRAFLYLS